MWHVWSFEIVPACRMEDVFSCSLFKVAHDFRILVVDLRKIEETIGQSDVAAEQHLGRRHLLILADCGSEAHFHC